MLWGQQQAKAEITLTNGNLPDQTNCCQAILASKILRGLGKANTMGEIVDRSFS
jgi:hypothetical protein